MSELFEEISEELKQENLYKLYKKYSGIVFTAVFLVVAGTVALVGWEHYVQTRQERSSNAYLAAVEAASIPKLDAITKETDNGFAALARFKKAELLVEEGKQEEAVAVYQALSTEFAENPAIADMARLMISYQLAKTDKEQAKEILKTLMEPSRPFYASARELLALIAQEEGDNETAQTIFNELANDALTPPSMKARAEQLYAKN